MLTHQLGVEANITALVKSKALSFSTHRENTPSSLSGDDFLERGGLENPEIMDFPAVFNESYHSTTRKGKALLKQVLLTSCIALTLAC